MPNGEKINLIVIPFHDYKKWINEGFRTRDAHLVQHFEKDDRVGKILVVNRPFSVAEMLLKRQSWSVKSGTVVYRKNGVQLTKMGDKTWCIDFLLMDLFKVLMQKKAWWFTAFHYDKVINAINEALAFLEIKDANLLLQNPMAIGAVSRLEKSHFIFDAIDNWMFHPQMKDKELIKKNYEYVEKNADLILTVSKALADSFGSNPNTHWVANGVDTEFFEKAYKETPSDKKIVGYVGKIQERVDFDLVEQCLKALPDVEFRILGPAYAQKDRIKELEGAYSNITFTGDVHYDKLPAEMKCFDIACIPHKVDKFTESMNPLKVYEYLAAGKPVVSTGVAGVSLSEYVYMAQTADSFINHIKSLITELDSGNIKAQKVSDSISEEYTWKSRSATILDLIQGLKE